MIRTNQQSKALHKLFREAADECVNSGVTLKNIVDVINQEGVYPDEDTLKAVFKQIGKALFNKSKTSEMTTYELTKTADHFILVMKTLGVNIDFPSEEKKAFYEFYQKENTEAY